MKSKKSRKKVQPKRNDDDEDEFVMFVYKDEWKLSGFFFFSFFGAMRRSFLLDFMFWPSEQPTRRSEEAVFF